MAIGQSSYHSIKGRKDSIAVLDVGSGKISCFIAEPDEHGEQRIIGIGHHHAQGIRAGTVTDSHAAESSIAAAVNLAEQMAGATVERVLVNLSLPNTLSHLLHVDVNISGGTVSEQDIADIVREACAAVEKENRHIVHCFVTQYQLDGARGIRDPRNMFGSMLKADVHVITVDERRMMNLARAISRCHLDISEFMVSSHTAALGCLEADERELGVLMLDMGATETHLCIFNQSANIYSAVIPIGGQHVTKDLAQGLSTGLTQAERLKTLHGSVLASANDEQSMVHVHPMGEDDTHPDDSAVPRARLVEIIRPRIEEIFEAALERIEAERLESQIGRHVVLTGGASQLVGVRELATTMFERHVRLAKPRMFPGLAESVSGAGFSATLGMLHYALERPFEDALLKGIVGKQTGGNAALKDWLMQWINVLKRRF